MCQDGGVVNTWALPSFVADLVFLSWIYSALITMLQKLRAANETYKLDMYTKLGRTISVFVLLFAALTVAMVMLQESTANWLYQWLWLMTSTWEILNFAVM